MALLHRDLFRIFLLSPNLQADFPSTTVASCPNRSLPPHGSRTSHLISLTDDRRKPPR